MQLTHRPEDFPGFFATVLWVGVGVFLFWTTPGAGFLTWQAFVYFVIGTIAIGILFGIVGLTVLIFPVAWTLMTHAIPLPILDTAVAPAILITVMGINLLGDWLREDLDPKRRGQ